MTTNSTTSIALVTGASRGLGRALALDLYAAGWQLVLDGRTPDALRAAADAMPGAIALAGDVTDADHRAALVAAVRELGGLDLLVNNASELGPSPLPRVADLPLDAARAVYETNVLAPLALVQLFLPYLRASAGTVLNISSDAAIEAYETWGGYGSSKAALDQLSAILAAEEPQVRVFAVDPGDMRTDMHQRAFPGEDISDRQSPDDVVPALRRLLEVRPASGRYRAADWALAGVQR
jgi:NAD(P)-dependent dehydrogenase (short-subunit alcohol dehydrogenase family)